MESLDLVWTFPKLRLASISLPRVPMLHGSNLLQCPKLPRRSHQIVIGNTNIWDSNTSLDIDCSYFFSGSNNTVAPTNYGIPTFNSRGPSQPNIQCQSSLNPASMMAFRFGLVPQRWLDSWTGRATQAIWEKKHGWQLGSKGGFIILVWKCDVLNILIWWQDNHGGY